MRVLSWTPFYLPDIGGIETLCAALHPRFLARGIEVTVVTGFGPREDRALVEVDGVPVHRIRAREAVHSGELRDITTTKSAVAEIKRLVDPDIVHIHLSGPEALFHLMTQRTPPVPTIVSIHNQIDRFSHAGDGTLVRRLLDEAFWITAVASMIRDRVLERNPGYAAKLTVIPNGVDVPATPEPVRDGPPIVMLIGRLIPQKAPEVAILAVRELRDRYPDLTLVVAGDGPLRPSLERLAESLHVADKVRFLGAVNPEEIPHLLRKATVVAMPSRWEGLPMAILEAAAMGRPLVSTAVGGLPEVVVHGESGLIVTVDDYRELASALARIIDHPDEATAFGRSAHALVLKNYSLARCADAYLELYDRIGNSS